jgi:hypothetical protein
VRHSRNQVNGNQGKADEGEHEILPVNPSRGPAMSEIRNHPVRSNQPKQVGGLHPRRSPPARKGKSTVGMRLVTVGDWVAPPPVEAS